MDLNYFNLYSEPVTHKDVMIYSVIESRVEKVGVASAQVLREYEPPSGWQDNDEWVGSHVGRWDMRWKFIEHQHYCMPGEITAGQPLQKDVSQRFSMNDQFRFGNGDTFVGFGCGQTRPAAGGSPELLRVLAVGHLMRGAGNLRNRAGHYVLEGYIAMGHGFFGALQIGLVPISGSPQKPVVYAHGGHRPDGRGGVRRRILYIDHQANGGVVRQIKIHCGMRMGFQSSLEWGDPQGHLKLNQSFDPARWGPGDPLRPLPFLCQGTIVAGKQQHQPVAGLEFRITEGRAFRDHDSDPPTFRLGGFGEITAGSGAFAGQSGVVLLNGQIAGEHARGCMLLCLDDI